MNRIYHVVTLLLIHFWGFGQWGNLRGYVKDADNGSPLAGVSVHLNERGTISDQLGFFYFSGLSKGKYEVQLSFVGYNTKIFHVFVEPDKTVELEAGISRSTFSLADVVISGKGINPVNTLQAVDIQLRPLTTAQDILRMVPGLFIAQHAGGGKAEQIFLRGYDLDHGTDINITVDGIPVNMVSHSHGQGYADLHFLEPELIENVSFEKGPYHAEFGNFATAGQVSFSTPVFLQEPYAKIEVGSYNTKRAAAATSLFNRQNEKLRHQWYASGAFTKTDGYFDMPQDFIRANFFTKYTAAYSDKTLLSISTSAFSSKWKASGQIPQRAVAAGFISRYGTLDSSEGGQTSRANINLMLQHRFNDHWSFSTRLFYSNYHFNLFSNFTFFLNDPINGDELQQKESRHLMGMEGILYYNNHIGGKTLRSVLGYGLRHDHIQDIELNRTMDRRVTGNKQAGRIQETNVFLFLNSNIELNEDLELNAGLRYDWFNFDYLDKIPNPFHRGFQQRGVIAPKFRLSYAAASKVKLFLNGGVGFHSNDTRVILNAAAEKILPRVYSFDLGTVLKPLPRLLIKASGWWMYSDQEFVYVGDEGVVTPAGETRRYGFDFETRYQFNPWLFGDIDLNLVKALSVGAAKGEGYIPLAAGLTSMGGFTAKSENGLRASIRYRTIGNRPANEDYSAVAVGYFLLDALAGYRWHAFDFSFTLQNMLNSDWNEAQFYSSSRLMDERDPVSDIHFTPGTPINLKLGVTVYF